MFADAWMAVAATVLGMGLGLTACGGDRPRHAGADSIGLSSGEQDSISTGGAASRRRLADEGSIEDYQAALAQLARQNDARLAASSDHGERLGAMLLRKRRLQQKLKAPDRAYSDHRDRRHAAQGRVGSFLIRFGPELQWEADFGIGSGDVALVSALVRDVVERLREQTDDPAAAREAESAAKLAADAFLQLGMLAEDMLDFETAERSYALARSYNPDLGVGVNTADAQIELFRALDRGEDVDRIESERAAMLTR